MNIQELKKILSTHSKSKLQIMLPNKMEIPVSFHITEIGLVHKTFIDCGGTLREIKTCQLQIWVGEDEEHRLEAGKAAKIFSKAETFLTDENIAVEIEYEDLVISQYQITSFQVEDEGIVFQLANKHTDCLAKELCGIPASKSLTAKSCCSPKLGCC